jgi:DNA repair exonuclease SbcCD nuclease subunit
MSLLSNIMASSFVIQLGDLFDTYSTSDYTLVDGYALAKSCVYTLAGNHDLSKNLDKRSALSLLGGVFGCSVVADQPKIVNEGFTTFVLVPHQHTQDLFEETLDSVVTRIQNGTIKNRYVVLGLHCNFGPVSGPAGDNYLTPAKAKQLRDAGVHLIVSGHEHNFRTPMDGVVMLGSILPFSFGEMEEKFVMDYDTQKGTYKLESIWKPSEYLRVSAEDFVTTDTLADNKVFIEVTGEVDLKQAVEVNRTIVRLFKNQESLLALKNNTVLHRHSLGTDKSTHQQTLTWLQQLLAECHTEEQRDALNKLVEEAK